MANAGEPNDTDLLTVVEVAKLTGLSRPGVYKRIANEQFPSVWTRGRVRVPRAAAEEYAAQKVARPAA